MVDETEKVLDEKIDVKSGYCEPLEPLQKPKKNLTEKQKEIGRANLAKGRETLAVKRKQQKEEQQKVADEMIILKAEKLVKTKANQDKKLKSVIGEIDDVEVEERVIIKPKKKKIIYREESDSEEEVIIRKPKNKPIAKSDLEEPKEPRFRINFC